MMINGHPTDPGAEAQAAAAEWIEKNVCHGIGNAAAMADELASRLGKFPAIVQAIETEMARDRQLQWLTEHNYLAPSTNPPTDDDPCGTEHGEDCPICPPDEEGRPSCPPEDCEHCTMDGDLHEESCPVVAGQVWIDESDDDDRDDES